MAAIGAGALAMYYVTVAPTFSWGDSADLPLRVFGDRADVFRETARNYVLYRAVGRVFLGLPFGDVAYRINIMSAVFGAIGVVVAYAIGIRRTGRPDAAAAGALALAVSHTWWWMSTVSEVYTFAGVTVLLALLFWLRWNQTRSERSLVVAAFTTGLAASVHAAGTLLVAAVCVHLVARRRTLSVRTAGLAVCSAAMGAAFLLSAVWHIATARGATAVPVVFNSANPLVRFDLTGAALKSGVLLLYQFPGPALLLLAVGFVGMWRSRQTWDGLVLTTLLAYFAWALVSRIPDVFNGYVFSYAIMATVIPVGAAALLESPRAAALAGGGRIALLVTVAGVPPIVYAAVPALLNGVHIDATSARRCPYRDNNWYFLFPSKRGDYGPRRFAESALDAAAPNAVVIADYTLWRPLCYLQQTEQRRTDLDLQFIERLGTGPVLVEFIDSTARSRRPVYLAAREPRSYYDMDTLERTFTIAPAGPLFELYRRPSEKSPNQPH